MTTPAETVVAPAPDTYFDGDTPENEAIAAELDAQTGGEAVEPEAVAAEPTVAPATLPPPSSPPPPVLDDVTRQRLARLEEMERQEAERAFQTELQGEVARYQRAAEERGFSEEQAAWAAQQHGETLYRAHLAQQRTLYEMAKREVARQIGAEYGVDPSNLLSYDHPDKMKAAAKTLATDKQRVSVLEKEVAELKKGRATPQSFNSPGGTGRGGNRRERLLEKGARGNLTPAEAKELWG